MTTRLVEKTSLKNKARIRLISEGIGSSGTYPADVLERDGAAAFPAGTHIFFDHLTEAESWERDGTHSIKDLVGVTLTDAEYVAGEKALYADARFFEQHAPFITDAMEYIGLSIEAAGVLSEGVVESLVPSPYNAISVVPRAGRDGKITSLLESYRERSESGNIDDKSVRESANHEPRKDEGMTPDEIEKVAEAVAKAIAPSFDSLKEALTPAPKEEEKTETPKTSEVAEAMATSGLPESARKRVYEALDADPKVNVAALIESEKQYIQELTESLKSEDTESPGRLRESASTGRTYFVDGWK